MGDLNETMYMFQSPGFVDKDNPQHVCKLRKAIYELKQAPRAWNSRFANYINRLGLVTSKADTSLFIFRTGKDLAYILLYVDDIILTASTTGLLQKIIDSLKQEFPMKDLGVIHHFLGIKADYNKQGLFLSQTSYAKEIIERAHMT